MQSESRVLHGVGENPQRVQRIGHGLHAGPVDAAEARLKADDPAECRRADHRAAGLRAERKRHHVIGDGRRRTARRAPRRMRGIARIASRGRMQVGELRRRRLAENHAARAPQQRHRRRVGARPVAAIDRRAVSGRHVRGVDDVLDSHRYAVQRPLRRLPVERARLRQRHIRIDMYPGSQLAVARRDAFEACRHQLLGSQPAGVDGARRFSGRQ